MRSSAIIEIIRKTIGHTEAALVSIIIHPHTTVGVLQICKHLIWHLRHTVAGSSSAHRHVRHHTRHHELIIVESAVHQTVWRELNWVARWGSSALVGRVVLEHLLGLHLHVLGVDHLGESEQFLQILFLNQSVQELLWTHVILTVLRRLVRQICVFLLDLSELNLKVLLLFLLLVVLLLQLLDLFLQLVQLIKMLLSLLLKSLNLFILIGKLHFQALVLTLRRVKVLLQLGDLNFEFLLLSLGLASEIVLLIAVLLGLHFLHV